MVPTLCLLPYKTKLLSIFHLFLLPKMAFSHQILFIASALIFSVLNPAQSATSDGPFTHSRAAYYPDSDDKGSETGRCGYGSFGATINYGDVAAASDLYRDGVGCGACYQVRCMNSKDCSDEGVTVVITDQGSSDRTDFIMSKKAFRKMAQSTYAASSLLAQGIVDIEYRRVSCSYPGNNITIKIDESSDYPYYLAFVIWYQQGQKDITAVQLCETKDFNCKLLDRSYGSVFTTTSPPSGSLSLRMLLSGEDGDEKWIVPVNIIPENWKKGDIYDTGVQIAE
ncbi:expansin-like B1 isoform X2 [Cynara cardunculus var. scolymus]|uniref:Barwin-like endoglucanase n=1 Tax=Cynara cardunculus var. scolymus TaxID=59895 RepID=A0A103XQY5_CYNCS|nr:expansin-like B1 isoform X2 [Cynara cardunculus var. scolymus]KVH95253.1 Barwin-like endoglucanase [Cynara cardunculus var. scolymus]